MNVSLVQAASALNANMRWQELISENLASSSIPGFRKQDLAFSSVQAGVMSAGQGAPVLATSPMFMPKATQVTNFEPGEITYTGVKTNLALEGPGFFELQLSNGTLAYSRAGEFKMNAQGELVTNAGYLVMSDNGPIQLDPKNTGELSISSTGEVSQGIDRKGKIKVVDFNDPNLLRYAGGGFFLADNTSLIPRTADNTTMRQGFLEAANTTPVKEMANLISTMRTYEANQRVIQLSDERISRSISDLANPN